MLGSEEEGTEDEGEAGSTFAAKAFSMGSNKRRSWSFGGQRFENLWIHPESDSSHRVDGEEFYQLLDRDGVSDDIHLFNEKLCESS